MMSRVFHRAVLALLATGALNAQTMVEYSSEARFQLDVHVPDAVLQARLPDINVGRSLQMFGADFIVHRCVFLKA